ncbi:MAG: T9SS type A sorting domain-containing protein [Aureispira sp.]|nr:T9SS type A sorting domain-containing protein [Aureispira sp.]
MRFIFLLVFISIACLLKAETALYFQNNTPLAFTVSATQYGPHTMSSGEWGQMATAITAWQPETELMWTNRNSGIHNGTDFFFDVKLHSGTDSVTLKIKLNGNFSGSDMWQSASGPGFSHPWYGDNSFHQATFQMGGKTYTLKYEAYFTGGFDDLLFALQEHDPFPANWADTLQSNILNVLSYNIYMLTPPISNTDQSDRAKEIPNHIEGYDVVIFNEAFYNSARDNDLIPGIQSYYPHYTPVVDDGTFNDDGGVFIASHWPIDTFAQIVYNDCNGSDCLAAKGVMYARIDKLGKKYHVFGTHTQAWPGASDVATRILQFKQLNQFIQDLNIPNTEPVIIGGDLNVDKIANNLNEYNGMLDTLDALEPTYLGHPYTYDGNINYYGSSPPVEFLDYVLTTNTHQIPTTSTNEVLIYRSIADDVWDIFDLSDHFAVRGRFVFPVLTAVEEVVEAKVELNIYPNPTTGILNVELPSNEGYLQLYNNLGQAVQQWSAIDSKIILDLRGYPQGVYYLEWNDGKQQSSQKLMLY